MLSKLGSSSYIHFRNYRVFFYFPRSENTCLSLGSVKSMKSFVVPFFFLLFFSSHTIIDWTRSLLIWVLNYSPWPTEAVKQKLKKYEVVNNGLLFCVHLIDDVFFLPGIEERKQRAFGWWDPTSRSSLTSSSFLSSLSLPTEHITEYAVS